MESPFFCIIAKRIPAIFVELGGGKKRGFFIYLVQSQTRRGSSATTGGYKMASLNLEHIYKKYPNGFEAVKDFNLDIEDKEFIIFVGPSGCGKSTTLRMIAGLEDISSGTL